MKKQKSKPARSNPFLHSSFFILPLLLRASSRCARRDDNGNAPKKIRRAAARTTARFFPGRFAEFSNRPAIHEGKTESGLRRDPAAVISDAVSPQTKTSASG